MPDLSWVDWPATFQSVGAVGSLLANVGLLYAAVQSTRTARAAVEAARTSAEAARRQTEVTAAIEAPVVRVVNIRIGGYGLMEAKRPKIPDLPVLVVEFVNGGRSPATIVSWGFDKALRRRGLPTTSDPWKFPFVTDVFLMPGERYETNHEFVLSHDERVDIMARSRFLWIWGFVAFVDTLGTERRQRFLVQALPDRARDDLLFTIRPIKPQTV